MMFALDHMCYFVPETKLQLEQARERFGLTRAQAKVYAKIYGLQQIPVAHDMSLLDLAKAPCDELLQQTNIDPHDIKVLIHTHSTKNIVPMGRCIARELKQSLGLQHALAFGMAFHNCATTLSAFETAALLLSEHNDSAKAIVVIAEKVFTLNNTMIPNTSISGDASAAVLISQHGKQHRLQNQLLQVDGQFSKGIWLSDAENKQFEQVYVSALAETMTKTLTQSGLGFNDIKLILPHNVNLISWQHVIAHLQLKQDLVYLDNVKQYAHCFGADIIINTVDAINKGLLQKNDYYLMATVGLGASFGAALFRF